MMENLISRTMNRALWLIPSLAIFLSLGCEGNSFRPQPGQAYRASTGTKAQTAGVRRPEGLPGRKESRSVASLAENRVPIFGVKAPGIFTSRFPVPSMGVLSNAQVRESVQEYAHLSSIPLNLAAARALKSKQEALQSKVTKEPSVVRLAKRTSRDFDRISQAIFGSSTIGSAESPVWIACLRGEFMPMSVRLRKDRPFFPYVIVEFAEDGRLLERIEASEERFHSAEGLIMGLLSE